MPEPDLINLFVRPLNGAGIRYFVSGSVAAMLYGEPRVTLDIDLVVHLRPGDIARLALLYPSPTFYVPPAEVIAVEIARDRRGHFNLIHSESGLKADLYTANRDGLHEWAFRHLNRYPVGTETVYLAPPEYVIVRKLEFFREGGSEKHLRDIRGILALSAPQLNQAELKEWIVRRGLESQWEQAIA